MTDILKTSMCFAEIGIGNCVKIDVTIDSIAIIILDRQQTISKDLYELSVDMPD